MVLIILLLDNRVNAYLQKYFDAQDIGVITDLRKKIRMFFYSLSPIK